MSVGLVQHTIPQLKVKPGTYRLINIQSNTALDLSAGDGRSFSGTFLLSQIASCTNLRFSGWTKHNNLNQHFIFTPLGHGGGYVIQNAWNGSFATVEDGICTGVPVVASAFPATWVLEECPQWLRGERTTSRDVDGSYRCFRIRWPNSRYVIDLEGYGCDKDGTRIQLAHEQNPIHPCQVWQFEEVLCTSSSSERIANATPLLKDAEDGDDEFYDASDDDEFSLIQRVLPNVEANIGYMGECDERTIRTTTTTSITTMHAVEKTRM
ncbi:hypothetical protein BT96DRAFT_832714 [Gymnopus androsaceus JB14]|uniref:Ricin B lectin domain-containing protein n=1 Tax=Gymnopus androsaceus JB14 TaxID=1447944 RepID=A0A6A4GYI0_9AGAR|nr:hypothetical protein BT96DRAFT_832714 [Gymnopus androsaceus JB14]